MTDAIPLHQLGANVASTFSKLYPASCVSAGSNSRKVRAEGHAAESFVFDCQITNKRIGVMVLDGATQFAIVVASKEDIDNTQEVYLPLAELNMSTLLKHMEHHFAK
ncbi:hypothetical protein [Pseudomonas sp. microsymbiont 2]